MAEIHKREKPSIEYLRTVLRYDPDTGKLFWLEREQSLFSDNGRSGCAGACLAWNSRYSGTEAFVQVRPSGYLGGQLGKSYAAHSVCWAMHHGHWPIEIDHINGIKYDNRILNLREVTRRQNSCNRPVRSDCQSGIQGVSLRKGRWRARICINGKLVQVGSFDTIGEAALARKAAEIENGFHENHGRQKQ